MTEFNLDFCKKYGYPDDVKKHFEEILRYINPDKVKSVILTGSTARGELSYRITDGNISLFSDYEFIVIARDSVNTSDYNCLKQRYSELQNNISVKNPLFHIDFSYISLNKLKKMQTKLWTYETKINGITVYGEDVKRYIPEVNLDNIDYNELNEILLWRLWALLLYLPPKWLMVDSCDEESETFYKYALCRNALDLTTWLLPLEGVLIPSFTGRVGHIHSNYESLQSHRIFGYDFPSFLDECLEGKLRINFHSTIDDLYEKTINYFLKADEFLLYKNNISNNNEMFWQIEKNSSKLFTDLRFKRQAYDILLAIKSIKESGLRRSLRWLFYQKYGRVLHLLYRMHLSFLAHLKGDVEDRDYNLAIAEKLLHKISLKKNNNLDLPFPKKWLATRRELANFMTEYFIWIKNQKSHVNRVLALENYS